MLFVETYLSFEDEYFVNVCVNVVLDVIFLILSELVQVDRLEFDISVLKVLSAGKWKFVNQVGK